MSGIIVYTKILSSKMFFNIYNKSMLKIIISENLTKIVCANSFLALWVKPLSLEETLYMSEDNFTIR